ncbi:MAG: hypothetical protein NT051_04735 [Candidatus Micrarchaeota archaeon]|nr:hypothetical protein [Candidatus Micrarchaeota archaeon]
MKGIVLAVGLEIAKLPMRLKISEVPESNPSLSKKTAPAVQRAARYLAATGMEKR